MIWATGSARAGVSGTLEPVFSVEETRTADQSGRTEDFERSRLVQNYRLTLDEKLTSALTLTAGGTLQRTQAWTSLGAGTVRTHDTPVTEFALLSLAIPALTAGAGVERRENLSSSAPATLVNDVLSAHAGWRPLDFPDVDLRLTRTHVFDRDRVTQDRTTTSALLGSGYRAGPLQLRYLFSWADSVDDLNGTEVRAIDQTAQGTYRARLFEGRTSAYANTVLEHRSFSTELTGPAGTVSKQQFAVVGLSLVELFPASPTSSTLALNPALVDGELTAGAGLDVGFGPSVSGDRSLRHAGAQLADAVTEVNAIHVWVDRALPPEVVRAFVSSWAAYRSDDNESWTPIAIQRVAFGDFHDRFELTIEPTRAQYLKVVTAPLPAAATTDPAFASIQVTELQLHLVTPVASAPRSESTSSARVNAVVRTALVRSAALAHDLSVNAAHATEPELTTYAVVNGLSISRQVGIVALSARGARRDQDAGLGHEGLWQWSASALARPLPTLHGVLSYSGEVEDAAVRMKQSVTLLGRAELYDGVSVQANAGVTVARREAGRTATTGVAGASAAVVPSSWLSLTASWLHSETETSGDARGRSRFERVDGTISASPFPALSGSATVTRILLGPRPTTLGAVNVSYSPFRGDLQLAVAYSRTLDTAAVATTQIVQPSARFTLRRGLVLNASYSALDADAPAQRTSTRVLSTGLLVFF